MNEVGTMTVPPPLPAKIQTRGTSQGARQTVSIRAGSPPSSPPLTTGAGATVFVGVSTPAVDSTAACTRRIPEVQSTNGYSRQSTIQTQQSQVQVHQAQPQQQQQQAAHVVKIKINPDGDKSGGRVISTVRLTLDGNAGYETENGITCEHSDKRDGAVVVSATNLANERRSSSAGESCVRISVNGNSTKDNQERTSSGKHKDENRNCNDRGRENKDMVQRGTSETLNNSVLTKQSGGCCYYNSFQSPLSGMVMSSGQCSPSDTLDSGTCSDLDGTPPPLPKKKNASSTVILGHTASQHNRTGSLTSSGAEVDSDDNESNISCDSLNGNELHGRIDINGDTHESEETIIGRQVRCRNKDAVEEFKTNKEENKINGTATKLELIGLTNGDSKGEQRCDVIFTGSNDIAELLQSNGLSPNSPSVSPCPSATSSSLSKASSTPRVRSPEPQAEQIGRLPSPVVKECTYEERKQEQERLEQESAAADHYANYNKSTNRKYVYEDDRFYKFHVNELQRPNKETNQENGSVNSDIDECFAGYKILEKEAIRSAKGTVRGVKNRVRAGIATFLQKPSSKDYKAKEEGKAVVYMTSSGIIRETYSNCLKVLRILRTHMVKYETRDLFYNEELQTELRDRMGCTEIKLPQLFVDGQWLGDGDMIEQLNESGELRDILDKYKSYDATRDCEYCGGVQWVLCQACNGSKKSKFRNEFTFEYFFLKCMRCDEAGLIPCPCC